MPPIAQSCTGDAAVDIDCCIDNPNPLNGWYVSRGNQSCYEPSISSANPATGSQHLRFARDPGGGNPPGCTGFGTPCRIAAFTPSAGPGIPTGPVVIEMDVAWSGSPLNSYGNLRYFAVDDGVSGVTPLDLYWHYYGLWFVYDHALRDFAFGTYVYGNNEYDRYRIEIDPCPPSSIRYYVDHVGAYELVYVTQVLGDAERISRAIFTFNNLSGHYDVDNYSVTRGAQCPKTCGNGTVEPGEDCEPGVAGNCPAGRCIAPGEPHECTCRRICTAAEPCSLQNGDNGPFLAPFDAAYGGIWHYDGNSPAVEFDTCGSTVLNSSIRVFASTTRVAENGRCCDPTHPNCISGAGSTPHATCYNPVGWSDYQCTCAPNLEPYGLDLQIRSAPLGASVMIHVGRKAECGGAMLGSCCTLDVETCTDDVVQAGCAGAWHEDVRCDSIDCTVPRGTCCNRSPGASGACLNDQKEADCAYEWTEGAACSTLEPPCSEVAGACCDSAPGQGGLCTETLQSECVGPYLSWTVGAGCSSIVCQEVTGACCYRPLGTCTQTTSGACAPCSDCVWTEAATCEEATCTAIQGACCVRGIDVAECSQTSLVECQDAGGEWARDMDCANIACDPDFVTIPTVSEWGLVVLALTMLIGGKLWHLGRKARCAGS